MPIQKSVFNISYNQNNPNVNKLIKDTFGSITNADIRVGYIDPVQGYVINVTVCEANEYAKKNPGTRFIFRDGNNNIRYITINEVNKLTSDDLIPKDKCAGIQAPERCDKPPIIQILGGGGVGALANPVIGSDGSLLAIDVVRGGYGYQYPPEVRIIDQCKIGSGAVARSVLGEIVDAEEIYEDEIEDYQICDPVDVGFGKIYGPNGEDLGEWDPSRYINDSKNNIVVEIEKYQADLIKYKNPFWTTRKNKPTRITSSDSRNYFQLYNVTFPAWNEFMNLHAVSPAPPLNTPGSDNAGRLFAMEWNVDFPFDGKYVFRGLCDNSAKLYIDNLPVADLRSFNDAVTPIYKDIKKGVHNVRIDLINKPVLETQATQEIKAGSLFVKEGSEYYMLAGGNDLVEISFSFDWDNNPNVGGFAVNKIIIPTESGNPVILSRSSYGNRGSIKATGTFKNGRKYGPILFEGNYSGSRPFEIVDTGPNPDNRQQRITFYDSGSSIVNSSLTATNAKQLSPAKLVTTPLPVGSSAPITNKTVFSTIDYISKANRTLWRINPTATAKSGFINQFGVLPFNPNAPESSRESYSGTHSIVWSNVNFPVSGNYSIKIAVDDNVTLYIGDTVITKRGFTPGTSTSTGDLNEIRFFKSGNYTIRAELEQISGNPLSGGNPMALAVEIKTSYSIEEVISSKSWNENPMGVSLTIDAPEPPVPQIRPPVQEGRCPPNPLWSTRFPGSTQRWYPVRYTRNRSWSNFMNEYAISPIKPLDTPGSDKSGITYKNSWDVEIPYDGFYGVKGTKDNTGRLLIDNKEISQLDEFKNNNPKLTKVYLTKGKHRIDVEISNTPQETKNIVDKKIFSTQDWQTTAQVIPRTTDISFSVTVTGQFANSFNIPDLGVSVSKQFNAPGKTVNVTKTVEYGRIYSVKLFTSNQGSIKLRTQGNVLQAEDYNDFNWKDIECSVSGGRFFALSGNECKFVVDNPNTIATISGGTTKAGVTYEGPPIFSYKDKRWANFMNVYSISPKVFDDISRIDPKINGNFAMTWKNVDFPEDGEYEIQFSSDNLASLTIGNRKVLDAENFDVNPRVRRVNITKGKYNVSVNLKNIENTVDNTTFERNPMGFGMYISKKIDIGDMNKKSWYDNPMGISAILIPPPCPRKISGRGVLTKIEVYEPGNGYTPPLPATETVSNAYPVTLELTDIIITNPGINYNCGVDQIRIIPDNGARLSYKCDPFGVITSVSVDSPGFGFTEYPTIYMDTETGVNFTAVPVFSVVRDPIGVPPDRLIQVTDLVGLKQTGYVAGRAYYGAVYYENGIRYAGYYKTTGTPIRVYDTLQESITEEATTRPSAIERSGTDIRSNSPNLNIPGTPQNTTE